MKKIKIFKKDKKWHRNVRSGIIPLLASYNCLIKPEYMSDKDIVEIVEFARECIITYFNKYDILFYEVDTKK